MTDKFITKEGERWCAIKQVYTAILKHENCISLFYDKFYPEQIVFMLRNKKCTTRKLVRMPK